jgi:hypothetical protein
MTYDETKLLQWHSQSSRRSGCSWSGELEIHDITESHVAMVADPTLACALLQGSLIQATPIGIYANGTPIEENRPERIVQADILDKDLALVVYQRSGGFFKFAHIRLTEDQSTPGRYSISHHKRIELAREASTLKLVRYG